MNAHNEPATEPSDPLQIAEYVRLIDAVAAYLDAYGQDEKNRCGLEMCRAYEAARDSILHANVGLDDGALIDGNVAQEERT